MSKHPYPKHVIKAVAKALMKSSETRDAFGAGGDWEAAGHTIKQEFVDHAETALQTLWDASRVDIDQDRHSIPAWSHVLTNDGYVIWKSEDGGYRQGGPGARDYLDPHAHVIFWGSSE